MDKTWLFTVEIEGFPQDDNDDPIEVHGGHRERWAVAASDRDRAATIIARKVYSRYLFERELTTDEIRILRLKPEIPCSLDGFRTKERQR